MKEEIKPVVTANGTILSKPIEITSFVAGYSAVTEPKANVPQDTLNKDKESND